MKKYIVIFLALVVIAGGTLAVLNGTNGNQKNNTSSSSRASSKAAVAVDADQQPAAAIDSRYITYAEYAAQSSNYKDARVVLYFHAPWCPTCRALDKNITANISNLPANTIIVKTDYDTNVDLRKKYGVTYQHTLVQIDSSGNKVKKWSGSPELKDLVAEIQA